MQGWGWSTDEEPDPAKAVLAHCAGTIVFCCTCCLLHSVLYLIYIWSSCFHTLYHNALKRLPFKLQVFLEARLASILLWLSRAAHCEYMLASTVAALNYVCRAEYADELQLWRPNHLSFLFRQVCSQTFRQPLYSIRFCTLQGAACEC